MPRVSSRDTGVTWDDATVTWGVAAPLPWDAFWAPHLGPKAVRLTDVNHRIGCKSCELLLPLTRPRRKDVALPAALSLKLETLTTTKVRGPDTRVSVRVASTPSPGR